jgi:hypothetical protein
LVELKRGGKISFGLLTLSKTRPFRGYAEVIFHCCTLTHFDLPTTGHNSTEPLVEHPPGVGLPPREEDAYLQPLCKGEKKSLVNKSNFSAKQLDNKKEIIIYTILY